MKALFCSACSKSLHSILFEAFEKKKKYTFYRCDNCDLIQIRPLQKSETEGFYSYADPNILARVKNQQIEFLHRVPFGRILFQRYIDSCYNNRFRTILKLRSQGQILDIGCGEGSFLKKFNNKWNKTGIEINKHLAKQARNKLKNTTILAHSLESAKLSKVSFDVITMWHVFEHLHNPKVILRSIRRHLNPSGYLVIEVPNGNSIYRKLFKNNWQLLLLPQHLFFWTGKSITHILEETGFQTVRASYPGIISFSGSSSLANFLRSKKVNTYIATLMAILFFPLVLIINILSLKDRDNILIIAQQKN